MKKAYTLLEILIVVIIIALMIGVFGFFMPDREEDQVKIGKECSNYIYNEINNSYNKLLKGYSENFSGENKKMNFIQLRSERYPGTNYGLYQLFLREIYDNDPNIHAPEYYNKKTLSYEKNKYRCNITVLSGERYGEFDSIVIDQKLTDNIYQGLTNNFEIPISSCINRETHHDKECIPISKITLNKTTQKIIQNMCLQFTGIIEMGVTTYNCTQWEQ